jgi:D-lactate dehydrogenase
MHEFLSADPTRLGRPDVPPCSDAVNEELVGGTPEELKRELIEILGADIVRHRISDLVRYASDASPYRYIPKVIVQPKKSIIWHPFFDIALAKVATRPSGPVGPV